jgi:hypothetical protein
MRRKTSGAFTWLCFSPYWNWNRICCQFGVVEAASQTSKAKESSMNNRAQPYQPLTSGNAALVLVDHQVGLMTGVRDYSTGELKHNIVALAKAGKALKLPIVVTTTARDSMWGPTFPELVEALP